MSAEIEALDAAAPQDVEALRREALRRFQTEGVDATRAWLLNQAARFGGIRNVLASP